MNLIISFLLLGLSITLGLMLDKSGELKYRFFNVYILLLISCCLTAAALIAII